MPTTKPSVSAPEGSDSAFVRRLGQYELIRALGEGGMAAVYLARDLRLGRLVAIKFLTAQTGDLDERVLAEARATARCRHENIVVIYEVAAHRGRPYMVLEYLEGQTLREWMVEHAATLEPRVSALRAVELMLPVVRALVCAHEQGIVHRDLKPENVMLTRVGAIKVLDFGVATSMEAPATGRAGTRPYMAPEQLNDGVFDHRADLWAVGVMLFELIAGAHPQLEATTSSDAQADEVAPPMASADERILDAGPLATVIDRCLTRDPEQRIASARVLEGELEAIAALGTAAPSAERANPFAGLAAFQEADANRFFGRARDVAQVVAELRNRPLDAVVGPSGAGKSSLVRAGVIPALRRSGVCGGVHVVRPGREPVAALARILDVDVEALRAEPGLLAARLRADAVGSHRRIVVFVDQLEELYTLGAPQEDRVAFLACLAAIADDASSPLRVLLSMRSDFLDRLADHRHGLEITRALVLLAPLDREAMREALRRPVEALEHRFEPDALVDRMVDAVAATRGALPLLQFTAARLWEHRDRERRVLTAASYDELGGVAGALAMHADAVLAGMTAEQRALSRAVMVQLVTPERTRAVASMAELHALRGETSAVDEVVQHLAAMRLVVVERSAEEAAPSVELVHESLIDRWPTFVRWLADDDEDAAMHARVRAAARDWERGGCAVGLLWTGEAAREAGAWQQRSRNASTPLEQRYLAAVAGLANRARRRRRLLLAAIVTASVVAAITMGWLARQQAVARQLADDEALRARDAARIAAMRTERDPTIRLGLMRELETVPSVELVAEARGLIHARMPRVTSMGEEPARAVVFSPDSQRIAAARGRDVWVTSTDGRGEPLLLRGHDYEIWSVVFSHDGRIATASEDGTVRIWNADGSGEPSIFRGHEEGVGAVAFAPDGRRFVSGGPDKTVRIWNVAGGAPLILRGHELPITTVAFAPDGVHVASGALDNTVRIWKADGSGEPVVLRGHDQGIFFVQYSPDGTRIVSASTDRTVRIWPADGSGSPRILRGHATYLWSAAFSPDGTRVVSASGDGTTRIWDLARDVEPIVLRSNAAEVFSAAFSPDGQWIVAASADGGVRVWDAEDSTDPRVLRGATREASSVAFSADGQRVVSASADGAVRVWNIDGVGEPLVLRGHEGVVWSAELSPDGTRIVSASDDNTVRIWNADGTGEPTVLRGHWNRVYAASFSPDGRSIVSASLDRTIRVWPADGVGKPVELRGHGKDVRSASFSADGEHIVSASFDTTVRVWRADGQGQPVVLRGHDDAVQSAELSRDGTRVVSASLDGTARVWNADGSGEPIVLRVGEATAVHWAAFSPDARTIAVALADRTVRIWPADGTGDPVVLAGHDDAVEQVRYSPDGSWIASASRDGTVRLWHDVAPITLDDPRLWTATDYCLPVELRMQLLSLSKAAAQAELARCADRVYRARATR
ncbi:MAG TPA: protein kinase [Nannocystaceae bacterium]|nr:protein kinase [Nannocystaceae bacterium]